MASETYEEKLKRTIAAAKQSAIKIMRERPATMFIDAPPMAPVVIKKAAAPKKGRYGFPIKR
jgi:hypothetical protein